MSPNTLPNPFDFCDRIVLVTGSGKGIGRDIALQFAAAGARVAVHYHASAAGAEEVASAILSRGGLASVFQADLTRLDSVTSLFSAIFQTFGHLDILINNAGTYPVTPLLEISVQEWDSVLDSNLRSVHLCTQAAARLMQKQEGGGAIINIASIEATLTAPGHTHYNAAKAGVLMHTRSAARELARYHIRVNAVSPGLIWREGIEEQIPEFVSNWKTNNPSGRLGFPQDIANACLFLASPAASWITGANLPVDGGALA